MWVRVLSPSLKMTKTAPPHPGSRATNRQLYAALAKPLCRHFYTCQPTSVAYEPGRQERRGPPSIKNPRKTNEFWGRKTIWPTPAQCLRWDFSQITNRVQRAKWQLFINGATEWAKVVGFFLFLHRSFDLKKGRRNTPLILKKGGIITKKGGVFFLEHWLSDLACE